jgi:parallel beta-helix repeat protein
MRIHRICLLLWLGSISLHAADIFVATDGDNETGTGTIGNPYQSIWRALQAASPGDTIQLRAGTYLGSTTIGDNFSSGDAGNPLTIRGYQNESVTVEADGWQVFSINALNGITLQNMTLVPIADYNAITILNSDTITLRNITIAGMGSSKPVFAANSANLTIDDSSFSDNAAGVLEFSNVQTITITNSDFDNNAGLPVLLAYSGTADLTLSGSSLRNHSLPAANLVQLDGLSGGTIQNNTFSSNTGVDLLNAYNGTSNLAISNNAFTDNFPSGQGFNLVQVNGGGSGVVFSGNVISNPGNASGTYDFANVLVVLSTDGINITGNTISSWSMPATGGGQVGNGWSITGTDAQNYSSGYTFANNNLSGLPGIALYALYIDNLNLDAETLEDPLILNNVSNVTMDNVTFSNIADETALQLNEVNTFSITNSTFSHNLRAISVTGGSNGTISGEFTGHTGEVTVWIAGGSGHTVNASTFTDNVFSELTGFAVIAMTGGTNHAVTSSSIQMTGEPPALPAAADPIAISVNAATGTTLSDNLIDGFAFTFGGESRGIAFSLQGTEESPIVLNDFSNNQVLTAGLRFLSANRMDAMSISATTFTAPLSVSNTDSLTLNACVFSGFKEETPLIVSDLNTLTITNSTFSGNAVTSVSLANIVTSTITGTGFFNNTSEVTVLAANGTDLTFSGNTLTDNHPNPVDAHSVISISNMSGLVTLENNTLANNNASIPLASNAFPLALSFDGCANLSLTGNSVASFLYTWNGAERGVAYRINGTAESPTIISSFSNNEASGIGGRALSASNTSGLNVQLADYDSSVFIENSTNATLANSVLAGNPGEPSATFTNVDGYTIQANTFTGGGETAVKIIDSPNGLIDGNTISGDHGNVGLEVSGTASSSITLSNNTLTDVTPSNVAAHSIITISGAGSGISLIGNTISNTEALIPLAEEASPIAVLILETSSVSLSGNAVASFGFTWEGKPLGVAYKLDGVEGSPLTGTTFTNNTTGSIAYRSLSTNHVDTLLVENVTYEGHLAFENSANITLDTVVSRNTTGEPGLFFLGCNGFTVTGSTLAGHGGLALKIEDSASGSVTMNTFSQNRGDSTVDVQGAATLDVTVSNNTFTNNYTSPLASFSGISVSLGATRVSLLNNTLSITDSITGFPDDASAIGILVDSIPDIEVAGNAISGYNLTTISGQPSGVGIDLSGTAESPMDATLLQNNTVTAAGTRGLDLDYIGDLTLSTGSFTSPIRIQNGGNVTITGVAYTVTANEPAISVIGAASTSISGTFTGNPGFALYFEDVVSVAVSDSTFSGNRGKAVIQTTGAAVESVTITNNTFNDNWPDPVDQHSVISFEQTSPATVTLTGNAISNSLNPGNLPDIRTAFAINARGLPAPVISANTISGFIYGSGGTIEGTAIFLEGTAGSPTNLGGVGHNTITGAGKRAYSISHGINLSLSGSFDAPVRVDDVATVTIANATFDQISRGALTLEQAEPALAVTNSSSLLVENSDFTENAGFAIEVRDTAGITIRSNTFTGNTASATVVVKGTGSTNLLIQDNVAINNYPDDLGALTGDVGEFSVIRVNSVAPGPVIENNRVVNEGEITASGVIEAGRFAFGIAVDATSDVTVRNNEVLNIRYPGYIDLKDPYNPDYMISPEEGGVNGTGISVSGGLNANITGALVEDNEVHHSANRGIIVYIASDSVIRGNRVSSSGQYGILLSGDSLAKELDRSAPRLDTMTGNVVENNVVWENGWLHGGMSGIALFHCGTDDGSFANIVRNNLSFNTRQGTYPNKGYDWYNDGMGIIFDVESNGNIAYNNICVNNDGPGIGIVKSDQCRVIHNTLVGNGSFAHAALSQKLFEKPGIEVTKGPSQEGYTADNVVVYSNVLYNNRRYQMTLADTVGHHVGFNLLTPGPDSLTAEDDPIYAIPYFVADPDAVIDNLIVYGEPGFSGYPEQVLLQNFGLLENSDGFAAGPDLSFFATEWNLDMLETDFNGNPRNATSPNLGALEEIPAGFFGDESKLQDGFWNSPTVGCFYLLEYPWIYMEGSGWIYAGDDGAGEDLIWDHARQKWYSWNTFAFPWAYDFSAAAWVNWSRL